MRAMECKALEKNIVDMIEEQQLKLGYLNEFVKPILWNNR